MTRLIGIAVLALVAAGCSDGSASPGGGGVGSGSIRAAQLVSGALGARDTARYVYRSVDAVPFVVTLTAREDRVRLAVLDPSGSDVVSPITAPATPVSEATAATGSIEPSAAATYTLVVTGYGGYTLRVLSDAPETAASRLVINDTIQESLDAGGEADVFTFEAVPGELFVGYLQTLGPDRQSATMILRGSDGDLASTTSGEASELETQPTESFSVSRRDSVRAVVRGGYVGPYRLMVRRIDRRPESLAPLAIENDTTVGERFDYVGDVDEFLIKGAPRALYSVLFQFANGEESQSARVEVSAVDAPDYFASVTSRGNDRSLVAGSTGRFALDETGTAKVTVRPVGAARGPYRFFVHRVDTLPELAAPVLAPTDSVLTEAHELPDDVDDFGIVLATDDTLRFEVAFDDSFATDPATGAGVAVTLFNAVGERVGLLGEIRYRPFGTAAIPLPAGRYKLRVASLGAPRGRAVGRYSVKAYRLRSRPEEGPDVIAIGDTVFGVIDPAGDVDEYRLTIQKGDHLRPEMLRLGGGGGYLLVELVRARDGRVVAYAAAEPLYQFNVLSVIAEEGGLYLLRARSAQDGREVGERGRYRLVLYRISPLPERHPQQLALGDSVVDEGIETPDDVDEFFLQGPPGGEYAVQFSVGDDPYGLDIQLLDASTKEMLRYLSAVHQPVSFGRLVFPASGRVMLRVLERIGPPQFGRSYPYRIATYPVRRAPETLPVQFAIGDTVTGESILPIEDIDEFEFSGATGQQLQALVTTRSGSTPGLAFQVFEGSSGNLVAAARVDVTDWELGPNRSQVFTLPSTGRYTVRVQWPQAQTGDYRFVIAER